MRISRLENRDILLTLSFYSVASLHSDASRLQVGRSPRRALHSLMMTIYSDMWDIMAFFRGGLNGEGAHDDLGKEIALAGKEWVRQCYRWEDIEAYQYR